MPPTLYHVPRTISSPLVQLCLELNLLEDDAIIVQEMSFAELKSPEHLAINTMGTSPAFRCSEMGLCMWESGAIMDYLLERHDTQFRFHPAPARPDSTPEELQQRTKFLHLKQFIIATVYPFLASMYIHTLKGGKLDEEYMAAAQQKCHACLGPALASALGEGPYFLGDKLSAVDLLAAKPLGNANSMGLLGDFPQLKALLERVQARPTYPRAYDRLDAPMVETTPGGESRIEAQEPDDQELVLVPKKRKTDDKENRKPGYHNEEVDC